MGLDAPCALVVGLYALSCHLVRFASISYLRKHPLAAFQAKDINAFPNRVVASINALLIGGSAILYLAPRVTLGFGQEGGFVTFPAADMTAMTRVQEVSCDCMMGYMLYDTYWYLFEKRGNIELDLLLHHLLGLASWLTVRHTGAGALYMMWVHMAELSTPLLHASWLLFKLKRQDTALFYLTSRGTILAFMLFRVGSIFLCLCHMYTHGALVFRASELGSGVQYGQAAVMLAFWALNITWLSLLLRMAATDEIRETEDKYKDPTKDNKKKA